MDMADQLHFLPALLELLSVGSVHIAITFLIKLFYYYYYYYYFMKEVTPSAEAGIDGEP